MTPSGSQAGFTLVELMLSMFLVSLLMAPIAGFFLYSIGNANFIIEQTRTIGEVKQAFRQINLELREVRTSEDGAYPLFRANDEELGFYADIDDDDRIERIRYYRDQNRLIKAVIEPNDSQTPYTDSESLTTISDKLVETGSPTFGYYNGDWPADTVNNPLIQSERLLNTRLIEISLSLNTDEDQQPLAVSTKTMLRNLKTNY